MVTRGYTGVKDAVIDAIAELNLCNAPAQQAANLVALAKESSLGDLHFTSFLPSFTQTVSAQMIAPFIAAVHGFFCSVVDYTSCREEFWCALADVLRSCVKGSWGR